MQICVCVCVVKDDISFQHLMQDLCIIFLLYNCRIRKGKEPPANIWAPPMHLSSRVTFIKVPDLIELRGLFTVIVRKGQVMQISELYKFSDSSYLSLKSTATGSSKHLLSMLESKIIIAHEAGEGYKETAMRFQVAVSSDHNVIKKWQITGTVEVKLKSGRARKVSEWTACRIVRKANRNLCLTAKDLEEDLADCGVVVQCTWTNMTFRMESEEEKFFSGILGTKFSVGLQVNVYTSLMPFGNMMQWWSQSRTFWPRCAKVWLKKKGLAGCKKKKKKPLEAVILFQRWGLLSPDHV